MVAVNEKQYPPRITEIRIKRLVSAAILALSTLATTAHAGQLPQPVASSKNETRLFAGLNWTFNKTGGGLSTRLGAIYTDTNSSNNVDGARLFLDFDMLKQGGSPSLFFTGFKGTTYGVGELGLGYNFSRGEFIGQFGGLLDHFEFGGNYGFGGSGLNGYVGVTSFKFDKVQTSPSYSIGPMPQG